MLIFDITTPEKSMRFLEDMLRIESRKMIKYIKVDRECDIDNFLEEYNNILNSISLNDIKLVVQHVTTNSDQCKSIKNLGLMNLKKSLSESTSLNSFLAKYNISFDILKRELTYCDQVMDITYNSEHSSFDRHSLEYHLRSLAHKVYYDFQINSFFSMRDETSYGARVHERPEFLYNLNKVISGIDIEELWKKEVKSYVITYEAQLTEFAWFSFYSQEYEFEEDNNNYELKKSLIRKAYNVVWNLYYGKNNPQQFAYMKPSVVIEPNNIISIKEII